MVMKWKVSSLISVDIATGLSVQSKTFFGLPAGQRPHKLCNTAFYTREHPFEPEGPKQKGEPPQAQPFGMSEFEREAPCRSSTDDRAPSAPSPKKPLIM